MIQILRNRLRPHRALLVVLAVYLAVTLAYGCLNPLGEAPDETAHVTLIRFIGQEGHLPLSPAERQAAGYKSDWPMLYHMLVGAITRGVDYAVLPRLKVNGASPRSLLIEDGLSPFALIHTEDETLPYQGLVLLWHLARLASTLCSAGSLVIVYAIALTICPDDRWLALSAVAVTAAIPRFHFIASAANDDNLLGLFSALFTLALVRAWREPQRLWSYAWLGFWFGLALATKYSVGLLLLLVVVILLFAIRHGKLNRRSAAGRLLLFGGTMFVAVAWWFVYIEWYFNEIKAQGWVRGLLAPLIAIGGREDITQNVVSFFSSGAIPAVGLPSAGAGATLWDWTVALFQSFWFVPGQANSGVVTALSLAFLGLCCLAVAGLAWAWYRPIGLPRSTLALLALQVGLMLPFPLLRFYLTRSVAETAQGRHILFPAVAAIGLLLTVGVSAWLPAAHRRWAGPALAGGLLAVSLMTFFGFTLPAFPPLLPVRTTADAAQDVPNPTHALFGSSIELAGYRVEGVTRDGALPVTLIWRGRASADQDYLVQLSLLDRGNQVRSLWLGQPVNGHYPTRAWDPGDVVRDAVWLPVAGVEAGNYHLQLRLCSFDGTCLPLKHGQTELYLTDVTIPPLSPRPPAHSVGPDFPLAGFDVWQGGQAVADMPIYRYRAAIPISLYPLAPSPESSWPAGQLASAALRRPGNGHISASISLVGPDGIAQTPQAQAGNTYIFLVGARWPSGEYRLRVSNGADRIESKPILRVSLRARSFDVPPMAAEVRANFGDEMMLLGYDFPERRAQPGGKLPITLY